MAVRHCCITSYPIDHAVFEVHALYGWRSRLGFNCTLLHFDPLVLGADRSVNQFSLKSKIMTRLWLIGFDAEKALYSNPHA
jgi:hypothetical protein